MAVADFDDKIDAPKIARNSVEVVSVIFRLCFDCMIQLRNIA